MNKQFFEVIDQHSGKSRFDKSRFRCCWAVKGENKDIDDHTLLEVWDCSDDEADMPYAVFPHPARVGECSSMETLCLPEVQLSVCPRCGYKERPK